MERGGGGLQRNVPNANNEATLDIAPIEDLKRYAADLH